MKKKPEQFTIQFNPKLPRHKQAIEFLNSCGRLKAHYIAEAIYLLLRQEDIILHPAPDTFAKTVEMDITKEDPIRFREPDVKKQKITSDESEKQTVVPETKESFLEENTDGNPFLPDSDKDTVKENNLLSEPETEEAFLNENNDVDPFMSDLGKEDIEAIFDTMAFMDGLSDE